MRKKNNTLKMEKAELNTTVKTKIRKRSRKKQKNLIENKLKVVKDYNRPTQVDQRIRY